MVLLTKDTATTDILKVENLQMTGIDSENVEEVISENGGCLMSTFKEVMATFFAVFGIIAIVGTVGAVESDQYMLALALFVMGTTNMFLSIICQEK